MSLSAGIQLNSAVFADSPAVRITRQGAMPLGQYLPALKSRLGIDFEDHNALLEKCVGAAIGRVESYTRHLLSPCTVRASFGEGLIDAEIPYGPIATPIPDLPTGATLTDEPFATIRYANLAAGLVIEYTAGYAANDVPPEFEAAVVQLAGELTGFAAKAPQTWKSLVVHHRRATWAD